MGLVQVDTETVTSAVSTVTLTGINTDDVYMVAYSNVFCSANDDIGIRVTTSGTPDSDSEYDYASKDLKASGTFGNTTNRYNMDDFDFSAGVGTSGTHSDNGILYLFNFNDSNEFSFITMENITNRADNTTDLFGFHGGGMHTVTESNDGISFRCQSGNNFVSGTYTLYKVT
tara:strand:+ start:30 stop:545 length:516 start_codon:yes stop_codon:yes gene_type:complete